MIAISGVAAAIGLKAVLESGKASGKVILYGTPAEGMTRRETLTALHNVAYALLVELSIGKIVLVDKRAFQDNVDVCLMLHPA